jgi:hypothetical protein
MLSIEEVRSIKVALSSADILLYKCNGVCKNKPFLLTRRQFDDNQELLKKLPSGSVEICGEGYTISKNKQSFLYLQCAGCLRNKIKIPKEVPMNCNYCYDSLREGDDTSSEQMPNKVRVTEDGRNIFVCREGCFRC